MKRFIKSMYDEVYSKDSVDRRDLIDIREGLAEFLIDVEEGKYFNAKENTWKEIS